MIRIKSHKPPYNSQLNNWVLTIILVIFISFRANNPPIIKPHSNNNLKEIKLGGSNYSLLLPINFEISEARAKEGGLGYSIDPKDSTSTMHGFIEIEKSNRISNGSFLDNSGKVFAKSQLADKLVIWKIDQTETGYFEAFTNQSGNLSARVYSKVRGEIDSLISIIATLKLK